MVETLEVRIRKLEGWHKSYWKFVTECLGHRESKRLGWKELVKEHEELCEFLEGDRRFKLIMMPRYSLKSCIATVGYSLWRMVKDENIRILIYSDSAGKAEGFLSDIKNHILGKAGNSDFRKYYPDWEMDSHKGTWNQSQVEVRIRTAHSKEPSVDTGGIETSKVGMHYDLIIFDDIVSDLNTTTKAQMDKVWDCYRKSLSLLKPGGDVVVVGTRWNWSDSYGRILEEEVKGGDWDVFVKAAVEDDRYPFEGIGLNEDFLAKQKERQGSYFFSCLYMNDPVDDSTALFKRGDFCFYKDVDLKNLYVTCTCDPAGEGSDYTAFTVVGTDKEMRLYLLYAKHAKYKPNQIVNEIVRLSYGYGFTKFGIESNTFNGMLETELRLRLEDERKNPQYKPFGIESMRSTARHGEGKHSRIRSLQPYHERGCLVFPGDKLESLKGSYYELAHQMLRYTESHKPINDDLIDSLSQHVKLARKGKGDAKEGLKEGSIAALIESDVREMNRMQRRLPRKYRQHYESFI